MRRTGLLLASLASAVLLVSGVALAENGISCPNRGGNLCVGTPTKDGMYGSYGADDMRALAGNDNMYGDRGDDRLDGGLGDDNMYGDDYRNIRRDIGDDRLVGGPGSDYLRGLSGADTLLGGDDDDGLLGEIGEDSLVGGAGDDLLLASRRISSEPENLPKADERDVLSGQYGDDTIDTHHYIASEDPPIAPVPDRVTCGPGTDTVLNADRSDAIADDCENVSFRPTN